MNLKISNIILNYDSHCPTTVNKFVNGDQFKLCLKSSKSEIGALQKRYELFFKKVGRVLLTENSEKKYLKVSKSAAPVSLTALV